jgi:hypothetical protein
MSRAIPLLPLWAFMVRSRENFISRSSSVSVVSGLRAGRPRSRGSIPFRASLECPDLFRDAYNLLFTGYQGLFPGG